MLDGQLRFWFDGAELTASAGDFVLGARGREHKFAVDSSEAHFLMLFTPAGFEDFTRTVGTAAAGPGLPPPGPAEPADLDALAAAARTAGIDITGPWWTARLRRCRL